MSKLTLWRLFGVVFSTQESCCSSWQSLQLGGDIILEHLQTEEIVGQLERANARETNDEGHKVSRRLLVSAFSFV
jgi:hypothetical protein